MRSQCISRCGVSTRSSAHSVSVMGMNHSSINNNRIHRKSASRVGDRDGDNDKNRRHCSAVAAPIPSSGESLEKQISSSTLSFSVPPTSSTNMNRNNHISRQDVHQLEQYIYKYGKSISSLRNFNSVLTSIDANDGSRGKLIGNDRFWNEMCYNLESFNAVFTLVLLKVQLTIGQSNYHDRDACLKHLIQPLGGEYGLSICSKTSITGSLLPTHRQLFQSFYESVHKFDNDNSSTSWSMKNLLMKGSNEPSVRAVHGENFFEIMLNDIQYCGMRSKQTCSTKDNNYTGGNDSVEDQAAYALGYNLAVEFLASYEKLWLLESFRKLANKGVIDKDIDWEFLEIHAEGEEEHASLSHDAIVELVTPDKINILARAMEDHDREFAKYYDNLTSTLAVE